MNQAVIPRGEHFVALAVVRSLGKKNIETTVVSEYKNAMSFGSKYCHHTIISDNSPDFYQRFSHQDLVMPTDEKIMIELARNRNKYQCSLAFPEYPILELAFDKKLVLDRARELKIPFPETIFAPNIEKCRENLNRLRFPAVVKPVRSFGGVGISFADSGSVIEEVVTASLQKFGPVLIQEKIPYKERYSVAILMNNDHEMTHCCVLRALRFYPVETGPATVVESVYRPDLLTIGETLLQSINYTGVAEIEFLIDQRDNTPKLMEINPRFWGSLQGAINAGVDFPFLVYKLFNDGDIVKNVHYKKGVRTRNAIANDYRRLSAIIRGNYPMPVKKSSIIEFLKFYKDDGYFIFSRDDIRPFIKYMTDTLRGIMKRKYRL